MKMNTSGQQVYGFPQGLSKIPNPPIIQSGPPSALNTGYALGQIWIWENQNGYLLLGVNGGQANWIQLNATLNQFQNQIRTNNANPATLFQYQANPFPTAVLFNYMIVGLSVSGNGSVLLVGSFFISSDGTTLTVQGASSIINAKFGDLGSSYFSLTTDGNILTLVIIGASGVTADWSVLITPNEVS